jgi:hypothetical protein
MLNWTVIICNTFLFILIGFAVWWTNSAWPLLGLVLSFYSKPGICQKCGCREGEEEDED